MVLVQTVVLGGRTLPVDGGQVGLMRNSTGIAGDPGALAAALAADGYILLRGFFPKPVVLEAQERVVAWMQRRGEPIRTGGGGGADVFVEDETFRHATANSVGAFDRADLDWGQELMHTEPLLRLLEGPELTTFFERLWGGHPVATLYRKWLRLVPAGEATTFHVDNSFFSLGTPSLTSAWVPLNDIGPELGGLAVIEGSNHLPGFETVRRTYGHDFSPGLVRDESGSSEDLWPDPLELLALEPAARWVTDRFKLGDVVIFSHLTFHGSCRNTVPGRLRLNADVRFQPAAEPMDPRSGSVLRPPPPHTHTAPHSSFGK
eukprot:SAG22_NODE_271_length_13227_cov_34.282983_1_plen_318_part_00